MNNAEFFSKTFLFSGLSIDEIERYFCNREIEFKDYSRKEVIYSPHEYERKLGFVLKGECIVERIKADGSSVPLNIIQSGDSFGAFAVLTSEDEFPTRITARRDSKIAFISQADVMNLIETHSVVAMNVIRFLAGKISFFNKKIATFSSDSVVDKLAMYLLIEYRKFGAELALNCKKTAESLNIGRASLYRAISVLEQDGIIKSENKKIYILDQNGLERITQ